MPKASPITRDDHREDVPKNSADGNYHGIHPPSPYRATKIAKAEREERRNAEQQKRDHHFGLTGLRPLEARCEAR
jgi:hypothetical protein